MKSKSVKKFSALLLGLLLAGCAGTRTPDTSNKIIADERYYTTNQGRSLARKYRKNLELLVLKVHQRFPYTSLGFFNFLAEKNAYGLFFGRLRDDPNKTIYLSLHTMTFTTYNTLRTNFEERAATVFIKHGRSLVEIACSDKNIMSDNDIYGISITIAWETSSFAKGKFLKTLEAVNIYAPKSIFNDFLNNKIDNQDFINQCKVKGFRGETFLGLIRIDLGKGL